MASPYDNCLSISSNQLAGAAQIRVDSPFKLALSELDAQLDYAGNIANSAMMLRESVCGGYPESGAVKTPPSPVPNGSLELLDEKLRSMKNILNTIYTHVEAIRERMA